MGIKGGGLEGVAFGSVRGRPGVRLFCVFVGLKTEARLARL